MNPGDSPGGHEGEEGDDGELHDKGGSVDVWIVDEYKRRLCV